MRGLIFETTKWAPDRAFGNRMTDRHFLKINEEHITFGHCDNSC
jgi:hypothetical protein